MAKTTRLPGWADLSEGEYNAYLQTEKRQYENRLNLLCPSEELRREARETSEDTESCDQCVYYCPNEDEPCRVPHTEAYMDALGIDACYEGALLYLCKAMERKEQESGVTFGEIDAILQKYRTMIYDNLETMESLLEMLIHSADKEHQGCYRLMRDKVQTLMGRLER